MRCCWSKQVLSCVPLGVGWLEFAHLLDDLLSFLASYKNKEGFNCLLRAARVHVSVVAAPTLHQGWHASCAAHQRNAWLSNHPATVTNWTIWVNSAMLMRPSCKSQIQPQEVTRLQTKVGITTWTAYRRLSLTTQIGVLVGVEHVSKLPAQQQALRKSRQRNEHRCSLGRFSRTEVQ